VKTHKQMLMCFHFRDFRGFPPMFIDVRRFSQSFIYFLRFSQMRIGFRRFSQIISDFVRFSQICLKFCRKLKNKANAYVCSTFAIFSDFRRCSSTFIDFQRFSSPVWPQWESRSEINLSALTFLSTNGEKTTSTHRTALAHTP